MNQEIFHESRNLSSLIPNSNQNFIIYNWKTSIVFLLRSYGRIVGLVVIAIWFKNFHLKKNLANLINTFLFSS